MSYGQYNRNSKYDILSIINAIDIFDTGHSLFRGSLHPGADLYSNISFRVSSGATFLTSFSPFLICGYLRGKGQVVRSGEAILLQEDRHPSAS